MPLDREGTDRSYEVYGASMAGHRLWNFWRSKSVQLPASWAQRHVSVVVAFMAFSRRDWHVLLVGDDGDVLLAFPRTDHADRILLGEGDSAELPIVAPDEEWVDVEQGWWAWLKADGDDVFIAETDPDALVFASLAPKIQLVGPGHATADGVDFRWSCVDRSAYDRAWQDAIASCRRGKPSPICEWIEPEDPEAHSGRVRLLEVA